jgi:DNA-directed RNA polymerase specialized sigma24 family protein
MASKEALWPALETGYEEEFGPVDPEVHRVARDLWPRAERLALDLLHDRAAGYRLLKRAVAALSGLSADRRGQIRDPAAYLFQTYKRLVLAELEKLNGHRVRELEAAELCRLPTGDAERIDRDILIAELVRGMDSWTREVFEAQVLGYSFDEIGRALGRNPHVVRNRFRLALRKLAATVGRTVSGQPDRMAGARVAPSHSFPRLRMMRTRLLDPSRW